MGQWVKWINKCDSLSTLWYVFSIQDVVTNIVFTLSLFAGTVSYTAYSSDSGDTYEEYRIS